MGNFKVIYGYWGKIKVIYGLCWGNIQEIHGPSLKPKASSGPG